MMLRERDRLNILLAIRKLVLDKHINVANLDQDYANWAALFDQCTPDLARAEDVQEFENGVRKILTALGSSHTAFFHANGGDVPPAHAINATLRAADTTDGKRWMFLDVIEDGLAHSAGIRPGELLLSSDSVETLPPDSPRFRIGGIHTLEVGNWHGDQRRTVKLVIPDKTAKDRPAMIEPRSLSFRMLEHDLGYVRVATFPGAVGLDFARDLDAAIAKLKVDGCQRLIIDLRGNMGGGLGSLRLMSYLCPGKLPIGYSLTRKRLRRGYRKEDLLRIDSIPSSKAALFFMALRFTLVHRDRSFVLATEGLGVQPFHGRCAILTNEFTRSAAEMVASFARENGLATLVGTTTSGEVLGGANFRLPKGYRLRMPITGWFDWSGDCIEGQGVTPHVPIDIFAGSLAAGLDDQLRRAVHTLDGKSSSARAQA
jgi:carboxyl-terminal processing protease